MESAELFRRIGDREKGLLSADEQLELQNWCAASEENKLEYEQLLAIYRASEDLEAPDTDASWKKLEFALKSKSAKKSISSWVWAAAAVFAISFGALWLVPLPQSDTMAFASGANEVKTFSLPDGTEVELNRNSTLKYKMDDHKRLVEFDGEAVFRVAKDAEHPFHINGSTTQIEVLGTRFRFTDRKESGKALVEVEEGKVRFTAANQTEKILLAGNTGLFTGDKIVVHPSQVNLEPGSFERGLLEFEDTRMAEVAIRLEAKYGVTIQFSQANMALCRFSGTFANQSLEQVLQILETTLGFESSQNGDTITFSGKTCTDE